METMHTVLARRIALDEAFGPALQQGAPPSPHANLPDAPRDLPGTAA
jgi:hypothetical protein